MRPTAHQSNPARTTFLLGVATVVAQSLLLREAMAAMGGSETAWGLVMALWLGGMGLGAAVGGRMGTPFLATAAPVATLFFTGAGTLLFRAAPAILGTTPGETLTTWHAVWLWALAVVPAAACGGLAFPILAGELGRKGPGRAYALEAAGALAGGLFLSFVLIRFGTAASVLATIGLISAALFWNRSRILAVIVMAVGVLAAIPAGEHLARATWDWAAQPEDLGHWAETRQQRLEISSGPSHNLFADGKLTATFPDPYTTLPRAHMMMLLHPEPRRVLAVGVAADGSVEALLNHNVRDLILVEEDPALPPLLSDWYGPAFSSLVERSEVTTKTTDPIRALDSEKNLDLVILSDGDPSTLRANRTRTVAFFRQCRAAMADDGILVLEVGVGDTYLGGHAGRLLAVLAGSLREAFPKLSAIPGERVLLLAGGPAAVLTTEPAALRARLSTRQVVAGDFPPEMLDLLLNLDRQPALLEFLGSAHDGLNTIGHPLAVSFAAALHEARSGSGLPRLLDTLRPRAVALLAGLLVLTAGSILIAGASGRSTRRARIAAWTVGFTSMGWWLLLLGLWQSTRGSVYAEIGALTALFMAGAALGCGLADHSASPKRGLPWLLGAGVLLSLVLATGLPSSIPTIAIPTLMIAGGAITGATFPELGAMAGDGSSRRGAGRAFSADELGAAAAALVIGALTVPWVGMTATALGLAMLGLAAVPAVWRA